MKTILCSFDIDRSRGLILQDCADFRLLHQAEGCRLCIGRSCIMGNADLPGRAIGLIIQQFYTAYDARGVYADENMNWLAGISDCTGKIRIQINITELQTRWIAG